MRGLTPRPENPRVESERGAAAAQLPGSPGEDGNSPQADVQADLHRDEWRGGVHIWESKEPSPAVGIE